jgi:hypothetical protein
MDPLGFEFLKDRYDFELVRKDQLTEALTLPIGVLTVLGSVLGAMAQSFNYHQHDAVTLTFIVMVVLDVIAFTVCLSYLARAYHAQTYTYLPTLKELHETEGDLTEFYESTGGTREQAAADFTLSFEERIIHAADANTASNDRRSSLLHRSRIALFSVLVLTALAGLPFVADQVRKQMPQEAPRPTAPARPTNVAPDKPAFPQNRIVREGANTTPPKIK